MTRCLESAFSVANNSYARIVTKRGAYPAITEVLRSEENASVADLYFSIIW